MLHHAFTPSLSELLQLIKIIETSSQKYNSYFISIIIKTTNISYICVREIFLITIDEHINAYQPSAIVKSKALENGEPVPVVYIPRKPHPNGLLEYLTVTFVKHPVRSNS